MTSRYQAAPETGNEAVDVARLAPAGRGGRGDRADARLVGGLTGTLAEPAALLLGRYDRGGLLRFFTCTHRLRARQRRELAGLQPMVFSGPGAGHPWPCPLPAGWAGRFTDRAPLPYLPVDPTLIAEIATDAATDAPFDRPRHDASLVRIRPDLHPRDLPRV